LVCFCAYVIAIMTISGNDTACGMILGIALLGTTNHGLVHNYNQDVQTYRQLNGGGMLKQVLTERGLWSLFVYRVESALPAALRRLFIPVRLLVEMATGISLPCTASIGAPLHIPHAATSSSTLVPSWAGAAASVRA